MTASGGARGRAEAPSELRRAGGSPADACVIGIDFGTLSGRAVVVRVQDGEELGSAVHDYANGVIESELPATGAPLPPQWALQDPEDWLDVLRRAVPAAVAAAAVAPEQIIGVATDFTASTPLPVLADGTPLCRLEDLADRPHAYPKLWKHHAAGGQADRINALARERGEAWLARYGGLISSEWEFAKALQVLEEDPEIYERMDRWVEGADWIVWQLCGRETRNTCTAGYKAIHQGGSYPSEDYLRALDERFADFVTTKISGPLSPLGGRAGGLTAQAAAWTGLQEGIAVAVGNVDAHVTAPAARAIGPGQMLMIMGTSTCHVMNGERVVEVPGMCGVVEGGIVPGLWGYEAGQSGVGDIFGWFVDQAVPPRYHDEARARGMDVHGYLSALAGAQEVGAHGLVALDWNNGNRSVLVDHELSGLIVGLTLATRAEDVYRALIEATAFGTRMILGAFADAGMPVAELFVAGGLLKNPVIMQIYADVTRMALHLIDSEQGPALGSAMHAAVAAGAHPDIYAASAAMGSVARNAYYPDERRADAYDALYEHYARLHDHFGRGGDDVMHSLRHLRPRELPVPAEREARGWVAHGG
jgi:L-ribulokinase